MNKYIPTIGIETHVQLKTKTKLFSAVDNNARQAAPNTLVSHIDVGMPGALPVLNQAAIDLCAKAALALDTKPQKFSRFDRKHYFYPDLPKGYQITQYEQPIIVGGYVQLGDKKIGIERANLEEDAGKNIHPQNADYSLVDLNRAGTPLLEIVSQPEIHSATEAKAYAREIWLLMRYAGVTDGDLYHGHVRFDINVSVSADPSQKGTRSEVKNLNSFRSVENAINYEIKRQVELLERGEKVVQETRGWDEAKQKTTAQRTKEEAHDYRYMPEPDIPPVELDDNYIAGIQSQLAPLPADIRKILNKSSISTDVVESILDNSAVCEKVLTAIGKNASNENIRRIIFDSLEEPDTLAVDVDEHIKVSEMLRANTISSNAAKQILKAKAADPQKSVEEHAADKSQVSDEAEIDQIVSAVLSENSQAASDVKNGQMKAIGFLVGQVMAASQGKANPQLAQDLIKKQLGL